MKKLFTFSLLALLTLITANAQNYRKWDFTNWGAVTIGNLATEAEKGVTAGVWSDTEKADGSNPQPGNCYWSYSADNIIDGALAANGVVIAETEGLIFNSAYTAKRSLAIAVNYSSTSLGEYAGPQYLWLGGGNAKSASARIWCFKIPKVQVGQKITIVAESHKPSDARGVALYAGDCTNDALKIGDDFKPKTKEANTWEEGWTLPEGATANDDGTIDVQVYNTNGCHIYSIELSGSGIKENASSPTFSLSGNQLTITTTTENASIYYTTDGSTPTKSSTLYTDPIALTQNCTVKAIAVADGYEDSEVAEFIVDWFSEEGLDTLELYAIETGSAITPNQPIMATQSVVVTPGNDVEWPTNMSMGSAWANPLDFTSNIYYPGSTTTYTFEGSMRGTNNPKDGDLEDGVSTGSGYKHYQKNYPKSGGYLTFEVQQEGSLIIPIRVFAGKPLYVTDKTGAAKTDIQFKDASGQTLVLQTDPLCAVSADEDVTGFVSFNVQPGEKYYVFSVGSKARFGGYVFSKQTIDIDPATMANVKDILETEPYAVLTTDTTTVLSNDSTGVTYGQMLTFYYDNQKEERGGMSVGPFDSSSNFPWEGRGVNDITSIVFDDSFANCTSLTSTAYWFLGFTNLSTIQGMGNLNTTNVTNMTHMFYNCVSISSVDLSNINTGKVTNMGQIFYGCSSLTNLNISNFDTGSVTNMSEMFYNCSNINSLDLSSFNTENVSNMSYMFNACSNLTTIYVGDEWTTSQVINNEMFTGCTKLVGGAGTTYDENNINDYTFAHIDGGPSNPGYLTLKLAMGDANGDGYVNIADAVATVTNILGVPTAENFYQYAADMNTDNVIDIFDVTLIVNAAFDAASPAPSMTRGNGSNIMTENVYMTAGADDIYLGVDQPERFTAMQFDVTLPEGTELVHVRLASATTDHQLSFVKRGENEYRVIGLSLSNATFRSLDGQLLKLQMSGSAVDSNVKMSNVLFVTPSNKTVTGIEAVNSSMSNVQRLTWYNLKGQRVSKQQLGKGIYIMNHKKVVIE